MVKGRSLEKRIEELVDLGQQNLQLYPSVSNWCRHINIQLMSSSMVAQFHNLPIGMFAIDCDHARSGGIQAMQLLTSAASFIGRNCRECPHHEMVDPDNVGLSILAGWEEEVDAQVSQSDTCDEASATAIEPRRADAVLADGTEDIAEESVLRLIELLRDPVRKRQAAGELLSASQIGAELFSELAVMALCTHFGDPEVGVQCISCVRQVVRRTNHLLPEVVAAARDTVERGPNRDEACLIIGDWIEVDGLPSDIDALVDLVLSVPSYRRIPGSGGRLGYPGATYALERIAGRDVSPLIACLQRRLCSAEKWTRFNSSVVLCELLTNVPELGPPLTVTLLRSLELEDDQLEGSADHAACNALGNIYVLYPEETANELRRAYRDASEEAKALIYLVYDKVVGLARWGKPYVEAAEPDEKAAQCLDRIAPVLIRVIGEPGHPVGVKFQAAETLSTLAALAPDVLSQHLDALMGTVALVLDEHELLDQKQPGDLLGELEKDGDVALHAGIVPRLMGAIEVVADLRPAEVLEILRQVVERLPSDDTPRGRFKGRLVSLYGLLGSREDLAKDVIPDLYKHLMDYDSYIVRGRAVDALAKILRRNGGAVPEGMIDVLVLQLRDPFVFVHKRAIRAAQYCYTSNIDQATELCDAIAVLDRVYADDPYFSREAMRALVHVASPYPELLLAILPAVIQHTRSQDVHDSMYALEELTRVVQRFPSIAPVYVREVVHFVERFPSDMVQHYALSARTDRFIQQVLALPRDALHANVGTLRRAAMGLASEHGWVALRLVELLLALDFGEEAGDLATDIAEAQPDTVKYEPIVKRATAISLIAAGESTAAQGNIDHAIELLHEAENLLLSDDGDDYTIEDSVRALSMADKIARDLERL